MDLETAKRLLVADVLHKGRGGSFRVMSATDLIWEHMRLPGNAHWDTIFPDTPYPEDGSGPYQLSARLLELLADKEHTHGG